MGWVVLGEGWALALHQEIPHQETPLTEHRELENYDRKKDSQDAIGKILLLGVAKAVMRNNAFETLSLHHRPNSHTRQDREVDSTHGIP